jgi:hypothetical protein
MNKAFKTNHTKKIQTQKEVLMDMKRRAFMSCHIKVGEPVSIHEHPLKDEILAKIRSGEVVFS